MKSSLWVVIVVVTGIVGFLIGYSMSAYTGTRSLAGAERAGAPHEQPAGQGASAGGYGGSSPAVPATATGGGYR